MKKIYITPVTNVTALPTLTILSNGSINDDGNSGGLASPDDVTGSGDVGTAPVLGKGHSGWDEGGNW